MKLCTESAAAPSAPSAHGLRLLGLVAVVENERALGEEEAEEACADEPGRRGGVADRVDSLGQHVEERDATTMPPVSAISVVELPAHAQRQRPPSERRDAVSPASGMAIQVAAITAASQMP